MAGSDKLDSNATLGKDTVFRMEGGRWTRGIHFRYVFVYPNTTNTEICLGRCYATANTGPTVKTRPWILVSRTAAASPCSRKIGARAIEAQHLDPLR